MKKILFFSLLATVIHLNAQELYIKTFGKTTDKPIIFLHGGPGYNCAAFEATTAYKLSIQGYFVIVYDRRGEGRSPDNDAKFTFEQSFHDLITIYSTYHIQKASLIGHSFGGVLAVKFAEKYTERVTNIIFAAAPVSIQESLQTIIKTSRAIYESKKDSVKLYYLNMLSNMDSTCLAYSYYCFLHAKNNKFYSPKNPNAEATGLYTAFEKDSLIKYVSQMTREAPEGFLENEKYTSIDLTTEIKRIKKKSIPLFGFYGKDDGLYSEQQIAQVQNLFGANHVVYANDCSHNVFIDQQTEFLKFVTKVNTP